MSRTAATTLNGRMLCASVLSYSVPDTGTINPPNNNITKKEPYYSGAGYLAPPSMIASITGITNAACTVGLTQDGIVIAFRGTVYNAITDWINDLLLEPEKFGNLPGKVHRGFNDALSAIFEPLKSWVKIMQQQNPHTPVYITGHSKGAGMAPIAAMRLLDEGIQAKGLFLYAPPLPATREFAAAYNKIFPVTYLFENYLDIVPLLPPSPTTAGGLDFYFLENGSDEAKLAAAFITGLALYNYSAVGSDKTTFYIPASSQGQYTIVPLTNEVYLQQVKAVGEAVLNDEIKKIAAAHDSHCGGGYMGALAKGLCPKPV